MTRKGRSLEINKYITISSTNIGDSGMASSNSIGIFQKLEKFSGKNNEDFTS